MEYISWNSPGGACICLLETCIRIGNTLSILGSGTAVDLTSPSSLSWLLDLPFTASAS